MFTGASQFALVSVLAGGGSAVAAVAGAPCWDCATCSTACGSGRSCNVAGPVGPAAQLTIDESTAMALAHYDRPEPRPALAFWSTGLSVFVLWNLGSLIGPLGASSIGDPERWGLDAAVPAAFSPLLWPQISNRRLLGWPWSAQ